MPFRFSGQPERPGVSTESPQFRLTFWVKSSAQAGTWGLNASVSCPESRRWRRFRRAAGHEGLGRLTAHDPTESGASAVSKLGTAWRLLRQHPADPEDRFHLFGMCAEMADDQRHEFATGQRSERWNLHTFVEHGRISGR
jgi:hypothetical protein